MFFGKKKDGKHLGIEKEFNKLQFRAMMQGELWRSVCIHICIRQIIHFMCLCVYICVYTVNVCFHVYLSVFVRIHDWCMCTCVYACIRVYARSVFFSQCFRVYMCVYTVSVCIHVSAFVYLCMLPAKLERSNFVWYAFLYETCLNGSLCGHLRYMYKCQYIDIFIYQYLFIYLSFYV